jgi:amino acid permease
VPRSYQGRDPREASQRSRSLHRRAAASSSSSSGGDETERATTTNKRRSRSRSRKQRLLPSLEDLRPRDAAAGGDENNGDSSAAASLLSAARAAAASSSTSSPSPSSSSSSNSVLSAVALIVGSSVGAGVLALPAVSAPAGFAPSATALVGVWALLTAEALLIAEVNLALLGARKKERGGRRRRKRRGGGGAGGGGSDEIDFEVEDSSEEDAIVTLREMAKETLGERGGHFVSAAYLALSYSLMVAYISKAGELVSSALDPLLLSSDVASAAASSTAVPVISPGTGAALFTAAMGLTLFGGTAAVDGANKAMTFSLLLAYAVIVAVGGAQADWGLLTESGASDWGAAPAAIPVILLSLVYHDLVPVVCAQLRGDAAKVRTALVVGSVAPLGMFILVRCFFFSLPPCSSSLFHPVLLLPFLLPLFFFLLISLKPSLKKTNETESQTKKTQWVAVALALVGGGASAAAANNSGLNEALSSSSSSAFVDPLAALTSSGGGAVAAAVGAFSLLAIVTSCLGTALGLSSTLTAEIRGLVAAAGAVKGEEEEKVKVKEAAAAKAAKAKKAKAAKSILPPFDPILRVLSTTLASFSEDDSSSEEEEEAEEAALLALTKTAATTTAIRVAAFALVLGPPLAASLANPGSFFGVLNAVGG